MASHTAKGSAPKREREREDEKARLRKISLCQVKLYMYANRYTCIYSLTI